MAQTAVDIVVKTLGADKLRALDRQLKGIEPSARKAGRAVDGVSKAVAGLGRALATAALGDQLRRSFGAAAEFSATQQRVQNLTKTYQQFIGIQNLAAQSAQRFGISNAQALSDLTDLGSRLGATGASLRDLENIYQGFNTLLVNNAVGAQQAAAATLQLNQALGSGRLAGEEFNAINEATPQLLDEVARVLNVARGELKELASEGKISSQVLLKALQNIKTQGADALADALDTPAGKLRQFDAAVKDFQVSVGTELLPVITPLVQELTKLVRGFGQLPEPIRTAAVAAATAAVGFGALNLALGTLGISLAALTGGALSRLATGLAIVGGGAQTTAVGFTAAGAAITKTTLAVNAATVALGALKVAIIALPLAALAAVLNENIQKKREFDDVMRSNSPDVLTGKIDQLTQQKEKLKSTLQSIQGGGWYKGMESDINQIQGQINELDKQIDAATRRRQLIVDIQVQGAIPDFDQLSDAGIQEALRLAGVGGSPAPVGGGGGGGGGGAAPTDDLAGLERQFQLLQDIGTLKDQQRAAELAGSDLEALRTQNRIEELELLKQQADTIAALNTEEGKALQTRINAIEFGELQKNNAAEVAQLLQSQQEAREAALQPLIDEQTYLQDILQFGEDEARIRRQINQIMSQSPDLDRARVEEMVRGNTELQKRADEIANLKQQYQQLASGIAGEMTGAFRSIIDGTKSVDEAFADMLKGIADKFLDMAMKILTDALTQQLMSLFSNLLGGFSGFGGGGGFGVTPLTSGMSFFADGGRPPMGEVSIVGERGPELFVPDQPGSILSNGQSKAALNQFSPGNSSSTGAFTGADGEAMPSAGDRSVPMSFNYSTIRIADEEYISKAQLEESMTAAAKEGAMQGEARALRKLQMSPSARRKVGL